MRVQEFVEAFQVDFFTGVPDSLLKELCNYLVIRYGIASSKHIVAANEGNCIGLAAGYHLATGKIPLVYMQNSGEGNAVNPLVSLMHEKVYAIPCILVIGWRGEPGEYDEPQHTFQGEITLKMLDMMEIPYYIVDSTTTAVELSNAYASFRETLMDGKQIAFVLKKNALEPSSGHIYKNGNILYREEALKILLEEAGDSPIVATTGKTSREIYEIRENRGQTHEGDFLTVGSMGHCSSIACQIALQKPQLSVWCIDGDGALLMHMGALAVIGRAHPSNLIHILINNEAHESVGGIETATSKVQLTKIAKACGYDRVISVSNISELKKKLELIQTQKKLTFLEIRCEIGSRKNLGRPSISANENKIAFMKMLSRDNPEGK